MVTYCGSCTKPSVCIKGLQRFENLSMFNAPCRQFFYSFKEYYSVVWTQLENLSLAALEVPYLVFVKQLQSILCEVRSQILNMV